MPVIGTHPASRVLWKSSAVTARPVSNIPRTGNSADTSFAVVEYPKARVIEKTEEVGG